MNPRENEPFVSGGNVLFCRARRTQIADIEKRSNAGTTIILYRYELDAWKSKMAPKKQ